MEKENKNYLYIEEESQFLNIQNETIKNAIKECINCKIISYSIFLITKIELMELKHRKIV